MEPEEGALRDSALQLLGRREHSRRELRTKLAAKAGSTRALEALLDALEQQGLLSDARFAAGFVRARVARGQGPLRIRQELVQKGVGAETVALALEAQETDWFELAVSVRHKRFGADRPEHPKEYARQARFLGYRGFSQEQVRHALETAEAGGVG